MLPISFPAGLATTSVPHSFLSARRHLKNQFVRKKNLAQVYITLLDRNTSIFKPRFLFFGAWQIRACHRSEPHKRGADPIIRGQRSPTFHSSFSHNRGHCSAVAANTARVGICNSTTSIESTSQYSKTTFDGTFACFRIP